MSVRLRSFEQIEELGAGFGLVLTSDETAAFQQAFKGSLASFARLDELAPPSLAPTAPRAPSHRRSASEHPFGGWYWKTNICTGADGLLKGKRVSIKDNMCVSGVPMMNGSALPEGYVPKIGAMVVTRILDAGGTIAGKSACEDLCFSGASHTCAGGIIRNPHNPAHSAGGSSGGSTTLVAAGEVPMAIGGDQGGSIRTPSSWCRIYGLKPTGCLVPMTGSMPISYSVDHCGPMCATVEDVARLLTVIAGHDGWDRRAIAAHTGDYMASLRKPAKGLRIGVLREGFGHPESDPAVDTRVRETVDALTALVEMMVTISDNFEAHGYRRMRAALRHRGIVVNHKKIRRMMRDHDLQPRRRRRYVVTTDGDHDLPIFPNLARDIAPEGPNQLWVADITYVAVQAGFVYVAVILDAWSRRVVGYAIGRSITRGWRWPPCAQTSKSDGHR